MSSLPFAVCDRIYFLFGRKIPEELTWPLIQLKDQSLFRNLAFCHGEWIEATSGDRFNVEGTNHDYISFRGYLITDS